MQAAILAHGLSPLVTPWCQPDPTAPGDVAGILAHQPGGACVFHGPPGCAIYADRPRSCEHFPFSCVIDPRGVHVTLSHFCPTAAEMLFQHGEAGIVAGPPIFADGRVPEGLDATESLPPTLTARDDAEQRRRRPGSQPPRAPRLMDWDEVSHWEQRAVRALAAETCVPEAPTMALFDHARAAVPAGLSWPGAPTDVEDVWSEWVAPAWRAWASVAGRYLASKVHASWAMYIGSGPADVLRGVDIARAVLQVEATRQCTSAGRGLDEPLLKEAIRQSDLLLMHYADPYLLADSREAAFPRTGDRIRDTGYGTPETGHRRPPPV